MVVCCSFVRCFRSFPLFHLFYVIIMFRLWIFGVKRREVKERKLGRSMDLNRDKFTEELLRYLVHTCLLYRQSSNTSTRKIPVSLSVPAKNRNVALFKNELRATKLPCPKILIFLVKYIIYGKLMATLQTTVFSLFPHFLVILQLKKRCNR